MPKFTVSAPSARLAYTLPALLAAALVAVAGCSSDSGPTFPSNAPVQDVLIQKVPHSAPFLMIEVYEDELRLLGVPVDAERRWVDAPVTWESSRPSVATVETETGADGRSYAVLRFAANPQYVNPTNVDTVTVTATAGGRTGSIDVVVREEPRVDEVAVTSVSPFLPNGATVTLTATPRDGFGNAIAAPSPWTWATSAPGVVSLVDNQDGTATATIHGEGSATVSASVQNVGEDPATGTVTGTSLVTIPPMLTSGQTISVPDISADGTATYRITVPAGAASLVVQITGATSGDADLYVFAPASFPNSPTEATNFVCRPFLIGSNETCTINNPAEGAWGVRVHAYPDDGDLSGVSLTATVN